MPATSAPGHIRRKPQSLERRSPGKKTKAPKRSAGHAPNDFLKQTFLPVSHFEGFRKNRISPLEQQFFKALSNLSDHHNLELNPINIEAFPFNILSNFQKAKNILEKKQPGLELLITELNGETTLATVEEIGISYTLYFPPLSALDWLHTKKSKKNFQLVLSLFAYLNQSARMPLPSENDYMSGCYDAICDWMENCEDEYDEEEWKEKKALLTEMRRKQPILERAVTNPANLAALTGRVKSYRPRSEEEKKLYKIAKEFIELQRQYPARNFYQNIYTDYLEYDEDEYRGYADQYFGFFWDDNGWLEESLMQYINGDLQECSRFDQPVSIRYYNRKDSGPYCSIDFEKRLLQLTSELSSTIYKLTL
jgi:hypothetical protein